MSDVSADILAKRRVLPENVVSLSVFAFGSPGGFVVEGVLVQHHNETGYRRQSR